MTKVSRAMIPTESVSDSDEVFQKALFKLNQLKTTGSESDLKSTNNMKSAKLKSDVVHASAPSLLRTSAPTARAISRRRRRSWHDQGQDVDYDEDEAIDAEVGQPTSSMALLRAQEAYIAQLESETNFCRDQLRTVLNKTKKTLQSKRSTSKSSLSNFTALKSSRGKFSSLQSVHLKGDSEESSSSSSSEAFLLLSKERRECSLLRETLSRREKELSILTSRENEAAEQVRRTLEAVDQLTMERSEREAEVSQMATQLEKQQTRMRQLMEEQEMKLDEEREHIRLEQSELINSLRGKNQALTTDNVKLSTQMEMTKHEMSAQKTSLDTLRAQMELKTTDYLTRIQTLNDNELRLSASKDELERQLESSRLALGRVESRLSESEKMFSEEMKSVRARLETSDQRLITTKQELLEMTELNVNLERQLDQLRANAQDEDTLRAQEKLVKSLKTKLETQMVREQRLNELMKEQNSVIGHLRQQSKELTDRLEMSVDHFEREQREWRRRSEMLKETMSSELRKQHRDFQTKINQSQIMKSNRELQEELKRSVLRKQTLEQENKRLELEVSLLKGYLDKIVKGNEDNDEDNNKKRAVVVKRHTNRPAVLIKHDRYVT